MAEVPPASFSIEITDVESRGSRVTLTASSAEQAQFYDGDVIRGSVIVEVSSIYYLKYLGIELSGSTSIKVQRVDSTAVAPKSFKNKEVFLLKTQALAGTPQTPSLPPSRSSPASPAVTSQGRVVQLNRGRHVLPFELTLETGATPGSLSWQNTSMPSQATHNVDALLAYKLKYVTHTPLHHQEPRRPSHKSARDGDFFLTLSVPFYSALSSANPLSLLACYVGTGSFVLPQTLLR